MRNNEKVSFGGRKAVLLGGVIAFFIGCLNIPPTAGIGETDGGNNRNSTHIEPPFHLKPWKHVVVNASRIPNRTLQAAAEEADTWWEKHTNSAIVFPGEPTVVDFPASQVNMSYLGGTECYYEKPVLPPLTTVPAPAGSLWEQVLANEDTIYTIVPPKQSSVCPGGVAYMNSRINYLNPVYQTREDLATVITHEMGHNFGLGHANKFVCDNVDESKNHVYRKPTPCTPRETKTGVGVSVEEYGMSVSVMGDMWGSTDRGGLPAPHLLYFGLPVTVLPPPGVLPATVKLPLSSAKRKTFLSLSPPSTATVRWVVEYRGGLRSTRGRGRQPSRVYVYAVNAQGVPGWDGTLGVWQKLTMLPFQDTVTVFTEDGHVRLHVAKTTRKYAVLSLR